MSNDDVMQLAIAHWGYVSGVLEAHGENSEVIEKCKHHYITAFCHGHKHAKEETSS